MHLLTLLYTLTRPPFAIRMHTPGSECALSTHCSMHFPIPDDSQAQSTHLALGLHHGTWLLEHTRLQRTALTKTRLAHS